MRIPSGIATIPRIVDEVPMEIAITTPTAMHGVVLQVICQFVLLDIFNPNEANLGAKTSFIVGGLSILCWIYLFFYQPETDVRSFRELDEMFMKHVPARKFKNFRTNTEQMGEAALQGKVDVHHAE